MPTRHPLRDLPLESFLPSDHRASSKRPLSPSAALLSPSKRRILSMEGLYSPEKRKNSSPSKPLHSELVPSPSNPARRLDFGALIRPMPRKADVKPAQVACSCPQTPVQRAGDAPKLAPSPEITSCSILDTSLVCRCDPTSRSTRSSDPPLPLLIPREMPTFSDRQSVHWPGFDVHPDTHIAILASLTTVRVPDMPENRDEDDAKENDRPRRRGGKKLILDQEKPGMTVMLSRADNHPEEEDNVHIISRLTPSPGKKALDPREREQEKRRNMLIMVHELDHEFNEEENVEQQL